MKYNDNFTDTVKGKNFSGNNTGKRNKSDFYQTPYSLTKLLVEKVFDDYVFKTDRILEPACGELAIVDVLKKYGYLNLFYFDKYPKRYFIKQKDFLELEGSYDVIITNPPFSLAKEFILKAKELKPYCFIMLLPLSYLHGKERYDLIYNNKDNFRLHYVYVFTRYPMLKDTVESDGTFETEVYAWFLWENGYNDNPIIDWLDNNNYVKRKRDKK